jgi:hypothetical protein
MVFYLLRWWYGRGFGWVIDQISTSLSNIGKTLAVKVLLKTWFAPWKQITTTTTFANFIQKSVDSAVSRFVGFFVRTFMLITALVWAVVVMIFGIIWLITWAFIPILVIILPILFATEARF